MKFSKYWYKETQLAKSQRNNEYNLSCWAGSEISTEDAQKKAHLKIQNWIARLAQGQSIAEYDYQNQHGEIREELLEEISNQEQQLIAVISRNRYGALILNTDAVVIVDVDIPDKTLKEIFLGWFGKKTDKKAQTLTKIRVCYQRYTQLNFVIYQTYAGFRIIVTGYQHAPTTEPITVLFDDLQADPLYGYLCRAQGCFRARLTPKPWRCHSPLPPFRFPRLESFQQNAFDRWQRQYEAESKKYAVCYKLEQLGQHLISTDIQNIIILHDSYALKSDLPLA